MRVANRLIVLLVGIGLAAGGLLIAVEAVWTWTGSGFVGISGRQWLHNFETTQWSTNEVVAISVAVGAAGLVLLLVQVRPHKKRLAPFATDSGDWTLLRHSTETHLNRRLQSAVPTSPIKTRITPTARRWKVGVTAKAAESTRGPLEDATRAELTRLRAPTVKLVVKTTGATK